MTTWMYEINIVLLKRFQYRDSLILYGYERLITGFGINAANGVNYVEFRRIKTMAASDLYLISWTSRIALEINLSRKYCISKRSSYYKKAYWNFSDIRKNSIFVEKICPYIYFQLKNPFINTNFFKNKD